MKILVLGGSYFVGKAITEQLVRGGAEVTLLNRGTRSINNVEQIVADRDSAEDMKSALEGVERFDAIVDVSCMTELHMQNTLPFLGKFSGSYVFISSASVYSDSPFSSYEEGDELGGGSVWAGYGVEKYKAETLLFSSKHKVVSLRPPYIYGTENPEARERFIWNRLLHGKEILMPGTGNTSLQFLLADDLAVAVEAILNKGITESNAFNIASDRPVTFKAYIEMLADIASVPAKIKNIDTELMNCKARDFFPFRDYNCALSVEKLNSSVTIEFTGNRDGFEKVFKSVGREVIVDDVYDEEKERELAEQLSKAGQAI